MYSGRSLSSLVCSRDLKRCNRSSHLHCCSFSASRTPRPTICVFTATQGIRWIRRRIPPQVGSVMILKRIPDYDFSCVLLTDTALHRARQRMQSADSVPYLYGLVASWPAACRPAASTSESSHRLADNTEKNFSWNIGTSHMGRRLSATAHRHPIRACLPQGSADESRPVLS